MEVEEARVLLAQAAGADEPVVLSPLVLARLTINDIPADTQIEIGVRKDGMLSIEWDGYLYRRGDRIIGEADHIWSRNHWSRSINLEHYLDLIRRAIEVRQRAQGDVELTGFNADEAFVQLSYAVSTHEKNLGQAYNAVR